MGQKWHNVRGQQCQTAPTISDTDMEICLTSYLNMINEAVSGKHAGCWHQKLCTGKASNTSDRLQTLTTRDLPQEQQSFLHKFTIGMQGAHESDWAAR
jgi:hypothetical protein